MQETHQYEPARLAPGTRVVIRDEEWLIRCVDPISDTVTRAKRRTSIVWLP